MIMSYYTKFPCAKREFLDSLIETLLRIFNAYDESVIIKLIRLWLSLEEGRWSRYYVWRITIKITNWFHVSFQFKFRAKALAWIYFVANLATFECLQETRITRIVYIELQLSFRSFDVHTLRENLFGFE